MPHDHHARDNHAHADPGAGDARLAWAVAVNLGLTLAQVAGGLLSGSLALIADAMHNLSDAVALIIAFAARRIARRPADEYMSFGYGRAEVTAALVNYTTLAVLAAWLVYEGVLRLFAPQPVDGWLVVWIAGIALAVDLVTAALTWAMAKDSMNIRAAFLHNLADALGSAAVILAGTLMILFGWSWVDPLVTLMIAGYVLWHVRCEVGGVIRVLMLGSPPGTDTGAVLRAVEAIDGVDDIHHARLWAVQEHVAALDAHLVIEPGRWAEADRIKAKVKQVLAAHGIGQSTLEMECASHGCPGPARIGTG